MINPSLIESSMLFFQSKLAIYCIFFKAYDVVLVVNLFSIEEEVFRLKSFICKNIHKLQWQGQQAYKHHRHKYDLTVL